MGQFDDGDVVMEGEQIYDFYEGIYFGNFYNLTQLLDFNSNLMISPKAIRLVTQSNRMTSPSNRQKISFNSLKKSKGQSNNHSQSRENSYFASPKVKVKRCSNDEQNVKNQYKLFTNILKEKQLNESKKVCRNQSREDKVVQKKRPSFCNDQQNYNEYMLMPERAKKEPNSKRQRQSKKSVQKYFEGLSCIIKSKKGSSPCRNFLPLMSSPDGFRVSFDPTTNQGEGVGFNMLPFL